ncbi:MAG: hypothetical protein VYE22_08620 [Myxococcota bacterium]|nr:hypothetical protein [Myxococcota bacterium]
MTEEKKRKNEDSISDKVEEVWERVLEALENLVNPEPELVPVPVRGRRGPYRRR